MIPKPNTTAAEVRRLAGKCSMVLTHVGLYPPTGLPTEDAEAVHRDVHWYLTHGAWSALKPRLSIRDRARLAVIAGVLEGSPLGEAPKSMSAEDMAQALREYTSGPAKEAKDPSPYAAPEYPKGGAGAAPHHAPVPPEAPTSAYTHRDAIREVNRKTLALSGEARDAGRLWLQQVYDLDPRKTVKAAAKRRMVQLYGEGPTVQPEQPA